MVGLTDFTDSELLHRLNQAALQPPSYSEIEAFLTEAAASLYLTTPPPQTLNAFLAPLEEEIILLGRGSRDEESGEEQDPPDIDVVEEAVLQRLAEIVEEPAPLENEGALPYLISAYSALRNGHNERGGHSLFCVATEDEKLRPWPLVQAYAAWLLDLLVDTAEDEPDEDEPTDDNE